VGHQPDTHAAVGGAPFTGLVVLDRLVLAQTDQVDLVGRNVVFRSEILDDRVGAAFAQVIVVIGGAGGIGAALYGNDVPLGIGNVGRQLVQLFFGLFGQEVLVEAKVDCGLAHHAIVVKIGHGVREHVNAVHGVVRRLLRLRGLLTGGLRLLVGRSCSLHHLLNASLSARVHILNSFSVLRGQVVEFIGLVDNRRGLLFDVILAGAADRRHHACCQRND